jgi:hypothetical protein
MATLPENTKLIVVPSDIVDQLRRVSWKRGTSLANLTEEALTQALRVDEMGATLVDAVDTFKLFEDHQGAGAITLTRTNLQHLLSKVTKREQKNLDKLWYESGKWYGTYLTTKFKDDGLFNLLDKDLKILWNLDETKITVTDLKVDVKCTSFDMSDELTHLLHVYIQGFMNALQYKETGSEVLRGLLDLTFLKMKE